MARIEQIFLKKLKFHKQVLFTFFRPRSIRQCVSIFNIFPSFRLQQEEQVPVLYRRTLLDWERLK